MLPEEEVYIFVKGQETMTFSGGKHYHTDKGKWPMALSKETVPWQILTLLELYQ